MIGTILVGLGTSVGKSVFGWLRNSIEDGVIQVYEWKKLAETIIVTGIAFFIAYYGLSQTEVANLDMISAIVAFLVSSVYDSIAKAISNKKKATAKKK